MKYGDRAKVFAHPSGKFLGWAFGDLETRAKHRNGKPVRAETTGMIDDAWWSAFLTKGRLVKVSR